MCSGELSMIKSFKTSRQCFVQFIITEKQTIKLTHYDEIKERVHNSHIRLKKTSNGATVDAAKDRHQAPTH